MNFGEAHSAFSQISPKSTTGFTFSRLFVTMIPMQDKKNINNNDIIESSLDINEVAEADARVYEVGYLLVPTISEEVLPAEYGNIKELVASFGGQMISDEMPKLITLAYPMIKVVANVRSKFDTAYFGWVKFEMDPSQVLLLKKKLDIDPKIIRFLIIKTVKENTIAAKRFVQRDSFRKKIVVQATEGETAPVEEINKEEIDKEIDAMVSEEN